MSYNDTIAAVATGGIISAIGIVRISGEAALTAADSVFCASCGTKLIDAKDRYMYYGELTDENGELIDLCLCMISHAPKSYTGEDTAEFHCHGSPVVLSEVMRVLSIAGVRQAGAGEFTKRAFLNGRMDLTQAEAVIDLIEAETVMGVKNAAGQLQGAVSKKIGAVYDKLVDVMAHFHAVIDYPDEDIDDFKMSEYCSVLQQCREELQILLKTHERGKVLHAGIPTAIVGRTNTGKSTLFNALLGFQRAIVTDIAGTTRDTIEEKVLIGKTLLRLIDTAGLRETEDTVEKLGTERTMDAISRAGLVLLVLDGSEPLYEEDYEVLAAIPAETPLIVVVNKVGVEVGEVGVGSWPGKGEVGVGSWPGKLPEDFSELLMKRVSKSTKKTYETGNMTDQRLSPEITSIEKKNRPPFSSSIEKKNRPPFSFVTLSAKTGEGLGQLTEEIERLFPDSGSTQAGEIITSTRQAEAIGRAHGSIEAAYKAMTETVSPDAVLTDIEDALNAIGEVTGKTMREDIISRIFERFCVGK